MVTIAHILSWRADTSVAWINSIFLIINLLILVRVFICLRNLAAKIAFWVTKKSMPKKLGLHMPAYSSQTGIFTWQRIT